MEYKLIVLDAALNDLDIAAEWYHEIYPKLSKDLISIFKQTLIEIQDKPQLSQSLNSGYRKINLRRFPYKVIFRIEKENIIVVALAHHKRKPDYWKKRK